MNNLGLLEITEWEPWLPQFVSQTTDLSETQNKRQKEQGSVHKQQQDRLTYSTNNFYTTF